MKNRMIQEFQHCLESRLIQVMIQKMQTIEFVSSPNLIQGQWIEVANIFSERQSISESRLAESKKNRIQSV
jgi:hypothetical protein